MKLKPQTELRILAAVLLAVAVPSLVGPIVIAPDVTKVLAMPWREVFASQFYHDHIAAMVSQTLFILLPCIGLLNGWVAWKLLAHAKKLQTIA